ncbi:hypothetical protein RSA42_14820 [Exiguobacterium indicum]|nr:hypothetical protein RSA42_14820 [Exiguobacterium indicum]
MKSRIVSILPLLTFTLFLILPVLLIDIFIIYLNDELTSTLISLILFLMFFYVISMLISFLFDGILQLFSEIFNKRISNFIFALVNFWTSLSILLWIDIYSDTVTLSLYTKILLVSIHTIIFYSINQFGDQSSFTSTEPVSDNEQIKELEREAQIVLQDYDPVTCIEKLSTKHPEYSKKDIIQVVRRIHNS